MNLLLIICSIYTALYSRVIIARLTKLCRYASGDSKAEPWGVNLASDVRFTIGMAVYAVASSVVVAEVLQFIWSFY